MNKNTLALFATLALLLSLESAWAGSATWNLNPTSGAWNTAANWTPATVPNGSSDVATFDLSDTTAVSVTTNIVVDSVVFKAGASAFITDVKGAVSQKALRITGAGVINNGSNTQNFTASGDAAGFGAISLEGSASAGSNVTYTANGNPVQFAGTGAIELHQSASADAATLVANPGLSMNSFSGGINFFDSSSAATATIVNNASSFFGAGGGLTGFLDQTRAGTATIINNAGQYGHGQTTFIGTSSADHATITNYASTALADAGITIISDRATAGSAIFTNYGTAAANGAGGRAFFNGGGTAGNASFTNYGADIAIGEFAGARTEFVDQSNAGNSQLMAFGGTNGGVGAIINFASDSQGDGARVILSGNGSLQISQHKSPGVTVGSLEGSGLVFLGAFRLSLGSNELSTTFSGVIQDGGEGGGSGGSLQKVGGGSLTLTGASTYTGGTIVSAGTLILNNTTGSATGTGAVQVTAGILGGRGSVTADVMVGGGAGSATLAPSIEGKQPAKLRVRGTLSFGSGGSYAIRLYPQQLRADQVSAHGIEIGADTAFASLGHADDTITPGTTFLVIKNTSPDPIEGVFSNLPDGGTITVGNNTFQANYEGGDGNDLTLTVIP